MLYNTQVLSFVSQIVAEEVKDNRAIVLEIEARNLDKKVIDIIDIHKDYSHLFTQYCFLIMPIVDFPYNPVGCVWQI